MGVLTLLAALALQTDAEVEAALKEFKARFKSISAVERAVAVHDLGKTLHPKTGALLASLLTTDVGIVRSAAAKALEGFHDHQKLAVSALQKAIAPNDHEPTALAAILAALGRLGDPASLPSILACLDHAHELPAGQAAAVAGALGGPDVIQPLIDQLKKVEKLEKSLSTGKIVTTQPNPGGATVITGPDPRIKRRVEVLLPAVRKALQTASGGETHQKSEDWQAWWNRARATFQKP